MTSALQMAFIAEATPANFASPGEWHTSGSRPPMTGNIAIDRRCVCSRSSRQRMRTDFLAIADFL